MTENYHPLDPDTIQSTQDALFELADLNPDFLGHDASDPSIVMGVFVLGAMSRNEEISYAVDFGSGSELMKFIPRLDSDTGKMVYVLDEPEKAYSEEALNLATSILHAADQIAALKD